MKLLSATVKNYRAHLDTTVVFDGEALLVAGPNEAGKSTLAEAVHRALFLKGKVSGALLDTMKSLTHGGDPYVSVEFLDDSGAKCRIEKTFGKNKTLLHLADLKTLADDAADEELARRLGVADTIDGKGWETKLSRRWAHLWIRQGSSGDSPFASVEEENQKLFSRLQQLGGAAIQASELDARLSGEFKERTDALWTSRNIPVAGSPLARAMTEHKEAEAHAARAAELLGKLESAISAWNEAEKTLIEKNRERTELESQLASTSADLEKVKRLDVELELLKTQAAPLRTDLDRLLKADKQIAIRRADIVDARAIVEKLLPKLATTDTLVEGFAKTMTEAKERVEAAALRATQARLAVDRLAAAATRAEAAREVNDLEKLNAQTVTLKKAVEDAQLALGKLPPVTSRQLTALTKAKENLAVRETALEAAGVRIRLVATDDTPVTLAGRPLGRDEISLAEEAEMTFGTTVRLRISPGGAGDLRQARLDFETAKKEFSTALVPFCVTGVDEASAVLEKVKVHQDTLKAKESALEALDPDAVTERLGKAKTRLVRAQAECERLGAPTDTVADEVAQKTANEDRRDAESDEAASRAVLTKTDSDLTEARKTFATLKSEHDEKDALVKTAEATLRTLLTEYGEDDSRRADLEKLRADLRSCDGKITALGDELTALQPDVLRSRLVRLERALRQNDESAREARDRRAGAEAVLRSEGTSDPAAEKELARGAVARAAARVETERVEASAVKLLGDLFEMHRAAVAEQSARPLAASANRYLACIHGTGVSLNLAPSQQGGSFEQATLTRRDGTTFDFDTLSGGAKEQVGVALRLAMTETLASAHGGTLPVVLDDAFVNSDRERVIAVRDMLDLAVTRGLQVIVLTCHPEQYSGMGWKEKRLTPSAPSAPRPASPSFPETTESDEPRDIDSPRFTTPVTGDLQSRFIAILEREGTPVSSRALREELGCSPEEFNATRDALDKRIITEGRSIKLA